jgi:hypothetical protein
MFTIDNLFLSIRSGKIRITDHADEEAQADHITYEEIFSSVLSGEIIEHYPDDSPYPSCLVNGFTMRNEPVHSVWAFNKANGWAVLVTVYRPDPERWLNWKTRKKRK